MLVRASPPGGSTYGFIKKKSVLRIMPSSQKGTFSEVWRASSRASQASKLFLIGLELNGTRLFFRVIAKSVYTGISVQPKCPALKRRHHKRDRKWRSNSIEWNSSPIKLLAGKYRYLLNPPTELTSVYLTAATHKSHYSFTFVPMIVLCALYFYIYLYFTFYVKGKDPPPLSSSDRRGHGIMTPSCPLCLLK